LRSYAGIPSKLVSFVIFRLCLNFSFQTTVISNISDCGAADAEWHASLETPPGHHDATPSATRSDRGVFEWVT
jgi:hypothetical protein